MVRPRDSMGGGTHPATTCFVYAWLVPSVRPLTLQAFLIQMATVNMWCVKISNSTGNNNYNRATSPEYVRSHIWYRRYLKYAVAVIYTPPRARAANGKSHLGIKWTVKMTKRVVLFIWLEIKGATNRVGCFMRFTGLAHSVLGGVLAITAV
jgi:hypothetical protein